MNKLIVYSLAGILTIGIIASCGDKSGTNAASPAVNAETEISASPQATAQPTAQATDQPATTPQPIQGTFTTGVFVDLDTLEDPLFNEEIKNLLNTTLEALANKKEEAFRSVFKDSQSADAFMYLFGRDYYFDTIGTVDQDKEGRVIVEIRGKVKDSGEIKEPNSFYYFMKDADNHWSLRAID
ncbi:hypothetical protein [Paenibacillus sp. IHBB 3054]|uniref:hypothetical protein n=1 Tax=Paenibacillus sp. IHBB 3054 TaxID=3425689 RepID=UPI003F6741EB